MKTARELVDEINGAELDTPHAAQDEIRDFGDAVNVTTVSADEHRWYTIGTIVYKVGDEFFGIRGPVSLKSESSDWSDIGAECEAFEMEEVPSVTYRRKEEV